MNGFSYVDKFFNISLDFYLGIPKKRFPVRKMMLS